MMSGFARKAEWVDPRTPNVVAINVWKAKEKQAKTVKSASLKVRRGRGFTDEWMLDMRGHKPQKVEMSSQVALKAEISQRKQEGETSKRQHQPEEATGTKLKKKPHNKGAPSEAFYGTKNQSKTREAADDETIDPHIPLPTISRVQKAMTTQPCGKQRDNKKEEDKPHQRREEGNHSSSSSIEPQHQDTHLIRNNKRKADNQLEQQRHSNRGNSRTELQDEKQSKSRWSDDNRHNRKRKAERQLEGPKKCEHTKEENDLTGDEVCFLGTPQDPKKPQHPSVKNATRNPGGKQTTKESSEGANSTANANKMNSRQDEDTNEEKGSASSWNLQSQDAKTASTPRKGGKQTSRGSREGEKVTVDKIQKNSGCERQKRGEEKQPPMQKPCGDRNKAGIRCFNCNARPQKGNEFAFKACPSGHAWLGFRPGQMGCNFCIRHLQKNQTSYEEEQARRKAS